MKLALEAKTGDRQPEREKPEGGEGSLSPETMQRYEGWNATPAGAVNVRKTSGGLRADVMNRTLRLIPRADGTLGMQYRLLGLFPIRIDELEGVGVSRTDIAGREILAARMHGREFAIGERLRPVPLPARLLHPSSFSRHDEFRDCPGFRRRSGDPEIRARYGVRRYGRLRQTGRTCFPVPGIC